MKTAYKNRFTRAMSVLLAAVMLFGYLVIPGTVRAEEEPFRIESSRISDGMISFYQNEKPVITVSGSAMPGSTFTSTGGVKSFAPLQVDLQRTEVMPDSSRIFVTSA